MKVLIVHNRYANRGGEDRAVDLLMEGLRREGHAAELFTRDNAELRRAGMLRQVAQLAAAPFSIGSYVGLRRSIRQFQPDVIHYHNVFPWITPAAYWAGGGQSAATVQTLHNFRFSCLNGLFLTPSGEICERCHSGSFLNGVRLRCHSGRRTVSMVYAAALGLQRFTKAWIRNVDLCLAPAPFVGKKLVETGFPAERVAHVPPFLLDVPELPGASRRHVLYVGRLSPEKGVDMLIDAWDASDVPLLIVGDGPERAGLEERASGKRNISFLGQRPPADVFRLLAEAFFLVMPSRWYENMPYVLLEAWSQGTPTLVSRLGSLADIVHQGVNGFLFDPITADSLRRTKERLLNSPFMLGKIRASVRAHYRATYAADIALPRLLDHYRVAKRIHETRINS